MDTVGKRLQFLREQANKTQDEIADCLNITQQTYSRYETGRVDLPLRHLKALTSYYQAVSYTHLDVYKRQAFFHSS